MRYKSFHFADFVQKNISRDCKPTYWVANSVPCIWSHRHGTRHPANMKSNRALGRFFSQPIMHSYDQFKKLSVSNIRSSKGLTNCMHKAVTQVQQKSDNLVLIQHPKNAQTSLVKKYPLCLGSILDASRNKPLNTSCCCRSRSKKSAQTAHRTSPPQHRVLNWVDVPPYMYPSSVNEFLKSGEVGSLESGSKSAMEGRGGGEKVATWRPGHYQLAGATKNGVDAKLLTNVDQSQTFYALTTI